MWIVRHTIGKLVLILIVVCLFLAFVTGCVAREAMPWLASDPNAVAPASPSLLPASQPSPSVAAVPRTITATATIHAPSPIRTAAPSKSHGTRATPTPRRNVTVCYVGKPCQLPPLSSPLWHVTYGCTPAWLAAMHLAKCPPAGRDPR